MVGNQRTCELFDVILVVDLTEQVPLRGSRVEWIQDHVTTFRSVEAPQIASVGIGDYGAIAARQGGAEHFADGRALAGAGGADELEVFGFILRRDGQAGQR